MLSLTVSYFRRFDFRASNARGHSGVDLLNESTVLPSRQVLLEKKLLNPQKIESCLRPRRVRMQIMQVVAIDSKTDRGELERRPPVLPFEG
jgi:hypothetical protein